MPGLNPFLRACLCALVAGMSFSLPLDARQAIVTLEDREHLSLLEVAHRFGMQAAWRTPEKELQLKGQSSRLDFVAASRAIRVNGIRIFLGDPILLHRKQLYISRLDLEAMLQPLLMAHAENPGKPVRTIVLDPGHGGRDRGTSNRSLNLEEKDLALVVAHRLRRVLEQQGYRVVLTRTGDTYVPLEERSAKAVSVGADLFVSIHFNAVDNPAVHGTETYILTPRTQRSTGQASAAATDALRNQGNDHDHWNALFGFLVHRQLLRDLGTFDRGIKRARFFVLRHVDCPAVLVEAGYLSNASEATGIRTSEYQDKLVRSLALGINQYRHATERISAARR